MSVEDIIITKATRSDPKDRNDIALCNGIADAGAVLDRLDDYSIDCRDRVLKTITEVLR